MLLLLYYNNTFVRLSCLIYFPFKPDLAFGLKGNGNSHFLRSLINRRRIIVHTLPAHDLQPPAKIIFFRFFAIWSIKDEGNCIVFFMNGANREVILPASLPAWIHPIIRHSFICDFETIFSAECEWENNDTCFRLSMITGAKIHCQDQLSWLIYSHDNCVL